MLQSVRHAFRALRRAPGFSAAAILILGLGIGANTAIFALMDAVLFRPLPAVGEPAALVNLKGDTLSYPQYRMLAAEARGTLRVAASQVRTMSLTTGGDPQIVGGAVSSANYFDVLQARPSAGTLLPRGRGGTGPRRRRPVARPLDLPVRRRRVARRADRAPERRSVHGHRRRSRRLPRRAVRRLSRSLGHDRRHAPARHRRPRPHEHPVPQLGLAESVRAPRARDHSIGSPGHGLDDPAARRRGARREIRRRRLVVGADRRSRRRVRRKSSPLALLRNPGGRGGGGAAHRLRESRQPAARARRGATARDRHSPGPRRLAAETGGPDAGRERAPLARRRRRGAAGRELGPLRALPREPAGGPDPGPLPARARRTRGGVRAGRLDPDRRGLRPDPGDPGLWRRDRLDPEVDGLDAGAALARARNLPRHAGRRLSRPAGLRGPPGPEHRQGARDRPRLSARPRDSGPDPPRAPALRRRARRRLRGGAAAAALREPGRAVGQLDRDPSAFGRGVDRDLRGRGLHAGSR